MPIFTRSIKPESKAFLILERLFVLQFMQRKMESDKPMKSGSLLGSENSSSRAEPGRPHLVFLEGEGNPLIRHCPGRRSFGKFNLAIEDHALVQIKAYRKLVKSAARADSLRNGGGGGDGGGDGGDGGGGGGLAGGPPDEEKDVTDREMAAALQRPVAV